MTPNAFGTTKTIDETLMSLLLLTFGRIHFATCMAREVMNRF
jgi:hypothetical protein